MKGFALAVLLALPLAAHSQAIAFPGHGPIGSLTATASYIYGESQDDHANHTLWGWSAVPEFNITRRFGIQAEVGSYYERIYPGQSRLVLSAGPRYNFAPKARFWPFVYAEGGEMRLTFKGSTYRDWDPVARVGIGFEHHLARNLSVTVIPAEYLAHNLDSGPWVHNFSAHAGFTYSFYRSGRGRE
jgi:hypothetical protein